MESLMAALPTGGAAAAAAAAVGGLVAAVTLVERAGHKNRYNLPPGNGDFDHTLLASCDSCSLLAPCIALHCATLFFCPSWVKFETDHYSDYPPTSAHTHNKTSGLGSLVTLHI
jgi:hypothetical protein